MIEIIPNVVDAAFLYFHTRCSTGDEIAPFVDEIQKGLPNTYIWAGDGCIEGKSDDPIMGNAVSYGTSSQRYWFVFPMHSSTGEGFVAATEAMGAVLVTSGGYVNAFVDQVLARFQIAASRIVLCGHQHGACVALAAAMMRRVKPFALTVLFDPWPFETLYLQHEQKLPATKVVCIDNLWVRERWEQSVDWIWWSGAVVLISVIDAYVDAHLDDMRFQVKPGANPSGVGVSLVVPY